MSSSPAVVQAIPSTVSRRHDDCFACRLVSGFGVIGIGAYVFAQARKRPAGPARVPIYAVSVLASAVGAFRLSGYHLEYQPENTEQTPKL